MPLEAAQLNASVIFKRRLQDALATGFLHCYLSTLQRQAEGRNGGWIQLKEFGFLTYWATCFLRSVSTARKAADRLPAGTACSWGHTVGGQCGSSGQQAGENTSSNALFFKLCKRSGVPFQNWEAALLKFNEDFIRKANKFAVPFRPVYAHKKISTLYKQWKRYNLNMPSSYKPYIHRNICLYKQNETTWFQVISF